MLKASTYNQVSLLNHFNCYWFSCSSLTFKNCNVNEIDAADDNCKYMKAPHFKTCKADIYYIYAVCPNIDFHLYYIRIFIFNCLKLNLCGGMKKSLIKKKKMHNSASIIDKCEGIMQKHFVNLLVIIWASEDVQAPVIPSKILTYYISNLLNTK